MYFAIYDEKTKEFKNIEEGSIDPVASKRKGMKIYLVPANSTEIIPTEKFGYVNIWNGKDWNLIEDNRGKEYWLEGDTFYDEPHEMKDLGPLPINAQLKRPIKTEEEKFEELCTEKRMLRDKYLKETDIYALVDYPLPQIQKDLYFEYRQYLRDIPQNKDFPHIEVLTFENWKQINHK